MDFLLKKCRGGVTVFLIIIMLPSFVFGGYVFDAARLDAAKTIVTSSGDLVFNALLSEFHDELYDNYGLLATQDDPNSFVNQAEMYFNNNLESSSMIQGSDAISLNIINSFKNFMNDSNTQQFDNLVKISAINNLSIAGANESQITNPDVMKNQIIEYMKYRGPVSLATGLITKLKTLGDVDKQAEAVNKKIEYEDKISEIGKKCQEAYDTINEYNDLLGTSIDDMLNTLRDINGSQIDYICKVLSLHNKKDNIVNKYKKAKLSDNDKKKLTKYSQEDLYSYIEKYLDDSNQKESSDLKKIKSALTNALALKNVNSDDYPETIYNAVKALEEKYPSYNKLYYYCKQYCDNYDKEMKEKYKDKNYVESEEDKKYKEKYEKIKSFKQNFEDKNAIIYQVQNNNKITDYSSKINEKFEVVSKAVRAIEGQLTIIKSKLNGIDKKLNAVKKAIDKAESAKKNYKNAIDDLAQSEYKASMKAEFESSARDLDKNKLKTLQNTVTEYKEYIDSFIKSFRDDKNVGTLYGKKLYKSLKTKNFDIEPNTEKEKIKENFSEYKTSGFSGTKPIVIDEEDKFYKYLKSICKNITGDESKKDKLDHVLSSAKPSAENKSLSNADSSISSASGYIEKTDSSEKVNNFESGKYDKNKTAEKFMNYFNSMGSFLKSITNLRYIFDGENSRDTLYISEYMTEMFSHYTSESGENDVTLAGKSTSTNPFYQSEVEYILCGMDTPQANIEAMKSKLYTTRFVLNLLYAMTDTQITSTARTTAASIAGSMPFMIPVIKTIIVCGFALGESTIDVKALMDGKDVAFIKTKDTFVFKPNRFIEEVVNFAEEEVTNAVVGGIDGITDKILGITDNAINSVNDNLNEYINKVSSDMVQNIESIISSAIFEKAEQIICNDLELSETDIEQELKSILNKIKNNSFGGKISEQIKNKIFELIPIKNIAKEILNLKNKYINEKIGLTKVLEEMNKNLELEIIDIHGKINSLVNESISGVGNELKNSIQEIAGNYSEDLKSEATEEINKTFDKFNQSISSNTTDTSEKGNSSAGAGFTMNYKEYLKLFVLLQNFDNSNKNSQRDAMLQRTANLIGINLKSKDKNIDLSKMYTIITINGDVDVETTFLDIPIIENEKGQKDFDFRSINKKSRKLNYESVRGY
ncbi:hypothetical protein CWE04_05450 [Thomasclavelia cocleata]|uniref:Uncharacterized protein n=1 Tax=Thomasclavelia cocleata TaxID=69824 RepID=A0A1I0DVZ1_9FIRM|nr:DUF5702 domain-containing protein [Thomasclavelia cocleata]MCR1961186.1 DUF5702 domain-containing protein [Thomasclavelia cocleata]NDO42082.1 hypothetical protein [Thomasclavelia cocleata]PJN80898.1 hypothetical protein CWE04_05450 [Thomasclavelia cocleata]SET36840.1 hypothetical protein SAMN04489758_10835 [Thomasclavelia cocleata]GFI40511.1 hypothetical protein IMSAGC017_00544 [Thomasclavelia cocleata]